jgi:hypothetical protein
MRKNIKIFAISEKHLFKIAQYFRNIAADLSLFFLHFPSLSVIIESKRREREIEYAAKEIQAEVRQDFLVDVDTDGHAFDCGDGDRRA